MLNPTDKKILEVVLEDSRLSLRQIAKKTHVSVATVMHHLRKLEDEKIIKKYTAHLNYEKIGYDIEVMISLRISKGKLFEVEKKIAQHPNVFAVYDLTGSFDAVVFARFQTRRKMDQFLKLLQTYDFVEKTETSVILNTMKEEQTGIRGV